jgi:hypothetical protein
MRRKAAPVDLETGREQSDDVATSASAIAAQANRGTSFWRVASVVTAIRPRISKLWTKDRRMVLIAGGILLLLLFGIPAALLYVAPDDEFVR